MKANIILGLLFVIATHAFASCYLVQKTYHRHKYRYVCHKIGRISRQPHGIRRQTPVDKGPLSAMLFAASLVTSFCDDKMKGNTS